MGGPEQSECEKTSRDREKAVGLLPKLPEGPAEGGDGTRWSKGKIYNIRGLQIRVGIS